jgi:hypothetical protein
MKKILLSIALLGLFGCSSSDKAEVKAEEAAITDQAKADIENAAENLKNEAEEMKNEGENTAEEAKNTASNEATTAFGDYTGTEKSKVTCSLGEDVRPISVVNGDNGGCGVVYNKMGESKTVAKAENVMEYCDEVQSKIQGNLESAGFTCE